MMFWKKKKFWIILTTTVIVLFTAISLFAGNYLVDYALYVDENGRVGSMGDYDPYAKQDTQLQKEFDAWIGSVPVQEWETKSEDGLKLWAQFLPAEEDQHNYIIAVHGYTANHHGIEPAVKPFVEAGYHVLTPDQRGCGNSEGRYLSMGYFEKRDVIVWINEILAYDEQANIVLYGESMGAATVLMAAGEGLPKQVKAVVEDCGYTTAYAMFKDQLKERFSLPEFPFLPAAALIGNLRAGFNFYDADALEAIQHADLPILFIHGGADDYVPTYMGKELYESYRHEKELLIVEGAEHGTSSNVDTKLYYDTIFAFLDKYAKA